MPDPFIPPRNTVDPIAAVKAGLAAHAATLAAQAKVAAELKADRDTPTEPKESP